MPLPYSVRHPLLALAEPASALLERMGHARRRPTRTAAAGETGERLAYFYLRRNGFLVVARRWRAPNLDGELDLIAWQGETLCFVEVKTRTAADRFAPGYAINDRKIHALRRMAAAYVGGLPEPRDESAAPAIRFDGISVVLTGKSHTIEHQPAIF